MTDRRRIEEEVEAEIAFHIEQRMKELEAAGLTREAARREALRRFGDMAETRVNCAASDERRARRLRRREDIAGMLQDVALAWRGLRSRPSFALVTLVTLALGIGMATAIFSAADHVLLRPLPYRDMDRVVTIWESDAASGESKRAVAPGNYLDWQSSQRSFESMGLAEPFGFDMQVDGHTETLRAWAISEGFLEALGVVPLLGRGFRPEEHGEAAEPAVLLDHGFWASRFGGDPAVVGQSILLDGSATTIVGVLPPGLEHPETRDLWAPKWFRPYEMLDREDGHNLVVARLRVGVSRERAADDLARIASSLAAPHVTANANTRANVVSLETHVLGSVRPALLVLLAAVGFLLLIACVNVASLLLARNASRQREIAVRAALGARRGRLLRQFMIESLLLAFLGGAAGLLVAWLGVRSIAALAPHGLPRVADMTLDERVLLWSLLLTLLTAFAFGAAPALRFSRADARAVSGGASRTTTTGRAGVRVRSALVALEIALALMLLVGAGLLGRSFVRLLAIDPGFQWQKLATLQLFLSDRAPTPAARLTRIDEIAEQFRALQGVTAVEAVSAVPFHPSQIDVISPVQVDGAPVSASETLTAQASVASPGYFALMNIPLLHGSGFGPSDDARAAPIVLLSESLARRLFAEQNPVGRRVTVGVMGRPLSREVVGVVGDVRPTGLDTEPRAELYVPYAQSGASSVTFVVRTAGDPAPMLSELRKRVWEVDRGQPVYHAATMESLISATLAERRFHLVLFLVFSSVALALSLIGVYGLASYAANARAREFGLRVALGSSRVRLVSLAIRESLLLALAGVATGSIAAWMATRFMTGMLFGIEPTDPVTFLLLASVMLVAAVLAAAGPAIRVTRADPSVALSRDG